MDFFEGIVGRFRKKEPQPLTPVAERKSTSRAWTYDHFREYLLALGRGEEFLLPINQYPDIIELSNNWHDLLDNARELTKSTGNEHYSDIGVRTTDRTLHTLVKPLSAKQASVPSEVVKTSRSHAKEVGIDKIPGSVHSHPHSDHLEFSVGDLYGMVTPRSSELIKGVVDQDENLFAFRARESTSTSLGVDTLDSFCRFWYEQNGWKYSGHDPKTGGEMVRQTRSDAPSLWGLNLKIAQKHNLVLYSGDEKTELVRVFPTKV